MSKFSKKITDCLQLRYGFSSWQYAQVASELVDWMAVIYEMLSPENIANNVGLPTFGIKKLGRTIVSKYKHEYTEGGTLGYIYCNAIYISPNPTENQLVYFVMLISHDLCQCLAMRKKTDKKVLAHGKEVNQLLEKVGLVWNGPKAHLTFTQKSWLKDRLAEAYPDAIAEIAYPKILPPPVKKPKQQQLFILDTVDQTPTNTPAECTSNAAKNEQQDVHDDGQPSYAVLLKTCTEQLKTIRELTQKLETAKVVTINETAGMSDELCCDFYTCPSCNDGAVQQGSQFCPSCGSKINWIEIPFEQKQEELDEELANATN